MSQLWRLLQVQIQRAASEPLDAPLSVSINQVKILARRGLRVPVIVGVRRITRLLKYRRYTHRQVKTLNGLIATVEWSSLCQQRAFANHPMFTTRISLLGRPDPKVAFFP